MQHSFSSSLWLTLALQFHESGSLNPLRTACSIRSTRLSSYFEIWWDCQTDRSGVIKCDSCILLMCRFTLSGLIFWINSLETEWNHYRMSVLRSGLRICLNCFSSKPMWSLSSWFCWERSFLEQTPTENAYYFVIKCFKTKSKLTEKLYSREDSRSFWITSLTDLYRSINSCKQYCRKIMTSKL